MACGRPVIATKGSSLAEIGGQAAYWIDDGHDVAAWSAALRAFAGDAAICAEYGARGVAQARRFVWEDTAATSLATLRRVAARA